MTIIMCPQYNAITVGERIAWPQTDKDALELVRLLTGRNAEWVEVDDEYSVGPCDLDTCIDGVTYHVTYNVVGTYHKHTLYVEDGDLMAVITGVHAIKRDEATEANEEERDTSGTGEDKLA